MTHTFFKCTHLVMKSVIIPCICDWFFAVKIHLPFIYWKKHITPCRRKLSYFGGWNQISLSRTWWRDTTKEPHTWGKKEKTSRSCMGTDPWQSAYPWQFVPPKSKHVTEFLQLYKWLLSDLPYKTLLVMSP